jgi:hypothetical protein
MYDVLVDCVENTIELGKQLSVVEAQNREALIDQEAGPFCLFRKRLWISMLRAVNLNDQVYGRRVEINDVFANWPLAIKRDAQHLLAAQVEPQLLFRVGHVAAECASERFERWPVGQHRKSPSIPLL